MKVFMVIIVSSFFTISTWAQDYPDSASPDDSAGRGFTNKAEAKNLLVNGLKEGKWVEYLHDTGGEFILVDSTNATRMDDYRLIFYKRNIPYGIVRQFYPTKMLHVITPYVDGKKNGIEKGYYKSGALFIEVPFINGVENGVEKTFTEDGALDFEIPYIDGKKNGIGKWYYDTIETSMIMARHAHNTIMMESPFINDKENGIEKLYNEDCSIQRETNYIDGNRNGIEKEFYKNGKLKREIPYSDDKKNGVAKDYTKDGRLEAEYPYLDGKLNGIQKEYYRNGRILLETPYVKGECIGTEKEYSRNGKIEQENIYSDSTNGESNWEQICYYPNGIIEMVSHYVDDNSDSAYRRTGVFRGDITTESITKYGSEKWWYKSGKLGSEIGYVNDSVVSEKYYDEKGTQIINGELKKYYIGRKRTEYTYMIKNGKLDTLINYDEKGKLYLKTPYSNGKRNGIEKEYYPNGKLKLRKSYVNDMETEEQRYDENGHEIK